VPKKISETNPYGDAVFQIRAISAGRAPDHVKMRDIKLVMIEFESVLEEVSKKNIVPLQQFPTGTNED
jgi:hypothetical protein